MADPFIGRQSAFGVAVEADRGTAESAAQRWIRKVVANIVPRVETVDDDTSFGRLEDSDRSRSVRQWNEGDLAGILHADVLGYFLTNIYGFPESAPGVGGTHSHVFTLEQTLTHPTLTMFVKDGEVRQSKIANGVISALEINVTTDNFIRFTAAFIGKSEDVDSSEVAYENEVDWISKDVSLKLADTEAGLGAATPIKAKTVNIAWDPGAMPDYVIGDDSPDNIYNGTMKITGSFTRNYIDQTFEDLYKSKASKYVQIKVQGQGDNEAFTLLGYKLQITEWSRGDERDALVEEEVSFKLYFNQTDEAQSEVTLVNSIPSYVPGS